MDHPVSITSQNPLNVQRLHCQPGNITSFGGLSVYHLSDILKFVLLYIYLFSHLADAFIQSDLQMIYSEQLHFIPQMFSTQKYRFLRNINIDTEVYRFHY